MSVVGRVAGQVVAGHLSPQCDGADAERLSRTAAIAVKPIERAVDQRPLVEFQVERVVSTDGLSWPLEEFRGQLVRGDGPVRRENDGALDRVFELPHVSG